MLEILLRTTSSFGIVSLQPIKLGDKIGWAGDLLTKFKINNIAANFQGNSPVGRYVIFFAERLSQENINILLIIGTTSERLLK
ncbi:MAG: hypothetical protein ACTMUB_01360 [cyanobacterium endosymbiont of Rhopalodia musculus]|uniref:hypothetical protein n=1 Tax=cyanobacterium endosymbiont of Epithemia clementina EcSB TaxID=3034674 RepID=UPI00247FE38E|nr:hypothetical protein [cyanobacterium endosymbiont of Epithemia clementina EcSB]WGT66907.1 hypothetical protein P3F56_06570 [cyanobacterium endosymbiont of Epithemia clementina EcSB]